MGVYEDAPIGLIVPYPQSLINNSALITPPSHDQRSFRGRLVYTLPIEY